MTTAATNTTIGPAAAAATPHLKDVLTQTRAVLITCLGEKPAEVDNPARRSVIERRIADITALLASLPAS